MVGVQGVGGVPEPRPNSSTGVRDSKGSTSAEPKSEGDDVLISSEAQAAATISAAITASTVQPDIRPDRVEAAREAIERGDHRDPDAVRQVAERIERIL